jgi:hypothetical protein
MAGLHSYGDFWHATRSEKLVNLWQRDIYRRLGSITSASSYGYGQMIGWRVLVGLGNGIMNSVSFSSANSGALTL